jgi:hypothetical protein
MKRSETWDDGPVPTGPKGEAMSETPQSVLETWLGRVGQMISPVEVREALRAVLAESKIEQEFTNKYIKRLHTAEAEVKARTRLFAQQTIERVRAETRAEKAEAALEHISIRPELSGETLAGMARAALRDTAPVEGFFARGEDGQYHPDPAPLQEDRSTAPWDSWKAAEARVRELEGALREWREAESSPDCIACCTLDAALADNVSRG